MVFLWEHNLINTALTSNSNFIYMHVLKSDPSLTSLEIVLITFWPNQNVVITISLIEKVAFPPKS